MDQLYEDIKRDEGLRLQVYRCPGGFPTVGYGHRVAIGDPISQEAADTLLRFDLARVVELFARLPQAYRCALDPCRRRVVCNMLFNLGLGGALNFRRMWEAILAGDFDRAAAEMLDSKWARQVGQRARRLADQMRRGEG